MTDKSKETMSEAPEEVSDEQLEKTAGGTRKHQKAKADGSPGSVENIQKTRLEELDRHDSSN